MRNLASWMTILAIAAATVLGVVAGGDGRAQEAPPINDNFANYTLVGLGLSPPGGGFEDIVQTGGATLEAGEPIPSGCAADGGGATVWYVYYPQTTSPITVDTAGSDFSTFIGVYRITDFAPSPPGGSLEQIACAGSSGELATATAEFPALTNHGGYAIQIGGTGGETGRLIVRIACSEGACPPGNDDIASAGVLYEMPFAESIDTAAAGVEAGEPLPCGDMGRTAWYSFNTFDEAGDIVSLFAKSPAFTPVIALYAIDYAVAPSPPGALVPLACAAQADVGSIGHTFTTEPFTTYYVQVGGHSGAGGALTVELHCAPHPESASPDGCFFGAVSVDTGGGEPVPLPDDSATFPSGGLTPPDTGSGGYLPGAR